MYVFLVKRNVGILDIIMFKTMNKLKLKKDYDENFSKTTGKETQSQHWGGNRQLTTEGIAVEYFPNIDILGSNESKYEFHSI